MKQRLQRLAMLMTMILAFLQVNAYDFEVDGIYYNMLSNNSVRVTFRGNYYDTSNEYSGNVIIPETVEYSGTTYSVTEIGDKAFYNCSGLTSVTIPNSVTRIGSWVFTGCDNLHSLTLGSSLLSIGTCSYLEPYPEKIIWLSNTPPDGYSDIHAKINYVANDNYKFGSGTTYVYDHLSSMFEKNGIIYVPVNPSERTCDIINCSYSDTVKDIALNRTTSFKGVDMTIANLRPYAFYGNNHIENLTINRDGEIPSYIFYGCENINDVRIPETITSVENYAFYGCASAKCLELKNSGSIGISAFEGCATKYGATLVIKPSVTNIGERSFKGCSALTSMEIGNMGSIGKNAFEGCATKYGATLVIKPSVTNIGESSFKDCSALTSMEIGNTGSIEARAFEGCATKNAATLVINPSVTNIGVSSFKGCSSLISAKINNTGSLGDYSFSGCRSLEQINIESNGYIGRYAFEQGSSATSLTIAPTIISIGDYAFKGCSSIANVTIEDYPENSDTVDNRTEKTFEDWKYSSYSDHPVLSYEWIIDTEAGDILSFEYWTENMRDNEILQIRIDGVLVAELRELYKSGTYAMKFDADKKIKIEANYIKDNSYYYESFRSSGIRNIGLNLITDRILILGSNGANPIFDSCPLDEVYIGRKLSYQIGSSYGYSPFYRNTSLRSVEITDEETQIYDNEFYGCTNLQDVKIGNGVTTFGRYSFSGCSKIEWFEFGSSVKTIDEEAFSDCTAMVSLMSHSLEPPVCGNEALDDINKWECTLHVPTEAVETYKNAPQWKNFFFIDDNLKDGRYFEDDGLFFRIVGFQNPTCEIVAPDETPNNVRARAKRVASSDRSIAIPETATYDGTSYTVIGIADNAFASFSILEDIVIPESVKYVGNNAFAGCTEITKVTVNAVNPPTAYSNTFDSNVYSSALLIVPSGAVPMYQKATCWKEFSIRTVGIDSISSDKTEEVSRYNLNGQLVNENYHGIMIIRYSDGSTRKSVVR